ncbi:CopG family transcriptional regulator [Streptomyces sp. NBC_01190]|uniref:CopG family transcriptional regulator n=1 Tax=Streptomyces sp. NBC_01190 TaxID=2903767 RepID=UPI0038709B50|nr:CopG family transcriptional regulator [Streptomyces sp. NBC_01190]
MSEPTQKYSITMPRDIAEAARARSGPSGLSAYVAAAVARQIERDNLNELIAVAEAEHGPITEEEIQARRDQLHQARVDQGGNRGAGAPAGTGSGPGSGPAGGPGTHAA